MHVTNSDGDTVDLPVTFSREQVNAALAALGIPSHIGTFRTTIEVSSVTVEFYPFVAARKRAGKGDALVTAAVTIPMAGAPDPAREA